MLYFKQYHFSWHFDPWWPWGSSIYFFSRINMWQTSKQKEWGVTSTYRVFQCRATSIIVSSTPKIWVFRNAVPPSETRACGSCVIKFSCPTTVLGCPRHPLPWSNCQQQYSRGVTSKVTFWTFWILESQTKSRCEHESPHKALHAHNHYYYR